MKRIISFYSGNAQKVSSCCSWLMHAFSDYCFNILNLIKDLFICLNYTLNNSSKSFKRQALLGGVLCALFMPGDMFSQQFRGLQTAMAVNVQHKNPLQKDPIKKDYQRFVYDNNQFYKESAYTVSTDALPLAGAGTPCTAHRWFAGDGWRNESTPSVWEPIVLSAPSLQPKGIVRCASSAETESQLEAFKGTYHEADNPNIDGLPFPLTDCFSMTTETFGNTLSRPTEGEEIVWLNFDIRPLAGTYQFQIVTNQNVGFVLFYVDPASAGPISGEDIGASYPSGLSGDCTDLEFSDIKIAGISHPACGFSGNGWTTITVPSFTRPTNYYLAMWMADENVTAFPGSMNLVYKSRFGCGGATCTLEHMDTDVVCNGDGTSYTACVEYGGSEGRWNIAAPGATSYTWTTYAQDGTTVIASGNTSQVTLGIIPDGAVFAKICAIYPLGVPYDISLTPDPTYRENDTGYIPCADGDRQTGASPTDPSLSCISDSLLNFVRCGVSASEAQSSTNSDFNTWFATFANQNPGVNPTISYVYSPAQAEPVSGHAPLNPGTGVPNFTETSVTVTWTIENSEGCSASCSAEFRITNNCLIGCTPTPSPAPCDGTPGGSIQVQAANGIPPYSFYLYLDTDPDPNINTLVAVDNELNVNADPNTLIATTTFTGLAAGHYVIRIVDQVQTLEVNPTECDTTVEQIPSVPIVENCTNDEITACGLTQAAIDADYLAWFNSLAPTGGTNLDYDIVVRDGEGNIVDDDGVFSPARCGAIYTATVTYSDDCDQSGDCTATYTVIGDTEDPVIVDIPDYQLQECNEAWPTDVSTTFTDNCGVNESLSGDVDGVLIGSGALDECTQYRDYRFRVVDDCGNDAEQTLRITRHYDETDPVIECPDDIVIGVCEEFPTIVTPQATDNCGGEVEVIGTRSDGLALSDPFPVGQVITVTFTATDDCNNDASCNFTVTVNPCDEPHCTYTQGYYGSYNGSACTPDGVRTTDYEIMRTALGYYTATTADDYFDFGTVSSGNYFRLKLSDVSGDPSIAKNNIYKMLPGGGNPRALVGFDTYDQIGPYANVNQKWTVDNDPLNNTTQRMRRGRINNNLLSQTMVLFFNRSVDGGLGSFEFGTTLATADVDCGSDVPDMETVEVYYMPEALVDYLSNNGGATVDNLFALANRVLGGEVIPGVSPTAVNSAVDNINNAFDGCRTVVAVPPSDVVINNPDVPVESVTGGQSTFTVYPVPFKDNITIRYDFNYQSKARIEVFDAKGMYLMSFDDPDAYYGKEVTLEPTFNTGEGQMFFIKLITDRGVSMKKVISKK
ncbi:HYR domain-containing protein [Flavobacterium enshiense]|uniref:HYR domain-containing protein n=1 Tax=Flavobacterium enshiense TaxID=1341165 RepID=UPI00345C75F1